MKKSVSLALVGIFAVAVTAFSNCSGFQAEQAPNSTNITLHSMSSVDILKEIYTTGVYTPPPISYGPPYDQKVTTTCSDIGSQNLSGNIVRSTTSLTLTLTNKTTGLVCTYAAPDLRDHLIGDHKLVVPAIMSFCPNATEGVYTAKLIGVGANGTSYNLLGGDADPIAIRLSATHASWEVKVARDANNNLVMSAADSMTGITPSILLGANQTGSDITVGTPTGFDENCDHRASPLLVQLHPGSSYISRIELSMPSQGVYFDILGSRATPAHTKRLISWFTPDTLDGNFFVTLPNSSGGVNGIDELFGDNTLGPDGQYASNGYEALRKYDVNHDGKITAADPVFAKLRLWKDTNHDGVAQAYELYSLDQYDVESIDFNYDQSFVEVDQYGNQIKLKSVVTTKDGLPHVMYDIWFKYY